MDCSDNGIVVARSLQAALAMVDGQNSTAPPRGGRYREQYVIPLFSDHKVACDEGSYFSGTNAVFGTGVAGPNVAAFTAVSPLFGFLNRAGTPAGVSGPRTYLEYIRLICTAIPTAGTRFDAAIVNDAVNRLSAGTAVTLGNPNQDATVMTPQTQALYAPTASAATSTQQQVARASVKVGTPVVGDEYLFTFGSVEKAGALIASATVAGRYVIPMPPIILGPGKAQCSLFYLWSVTSSTAPSFEFEVGIIER